MLRDQLSRFGFPRRIHKWIEPIAHADAIGHPVGFKERQQSAISWASDYFVALHRGGTKSEYYHEIIEPLDALRVPEFESVSIVHPAYSAKFAKFEAHRHRSGAARTKAKVTKLAPQMVPDPDGGAALMEGRHVEFRDLRIGDILELRYARDFIKPPDQGKFNWEHMFVGEQPTACARRRITIAVHTSLAFELNTHNFESNPTEWTDRGYRFMQWEMHELAAIDPEFNQPFARDCEPWVDVSTCPSWEPIARWLAKHLITTSPKKKTVRELLEEIAPAGEDARTRAMKCYDYCRKQVTYGRAHGIGPEADALPSDRVAESQRGDCKDQTSLLMGLLHELDIPCRAAAVHAGDPSRIDFLPSMRFDHVIIASEFDGETLWLDPTAAHVPFGSTVAELEGSRALLMDAEGVYEWQTIPHTGADRNRFVYAAKGRFDGRDLVLEVTADYSGRAASAMRAAELQSPGSIVKGMESFASERLGSCTVEHTELDDGWKTYDPIRVAMTITAPNWIKNAGTDMRLIKLPWIGAHIAPTIVARKERKRDYLTRGPATAEYHLSLRLPDGMRLETLPAPREFRGPQQRAHTTVENGSDGIELRVQLATDDSRIAAADYPAFRRFVHEFGSFFEDQHVLRRS